VGFGVADVSGETAGLTGVTVDHVAAIVTMAASRATKIPTRRRRFMRRAGMSEWGRRRRGTVGTPD
jgi:hypothetical protein